MRIILAVLVLTVSGCNQAVKQEYQSIDSFFSDGDRITFLGNSITHEGPYHGYFHLFYATRFPKLKLSIHNCGISGDVADGMLERIGADVLRYRPTHSFLMVGMNDVKRELYSIGIADSANLNERAEVLENYKIKTDSLVRSFIDADVKPILLTPSIYEQEAAFDRENKYGVNDALGDFTDHIKDLGAKYDVEVIDVYDEMNRINEKGQELDSFFTIVGQDRIHPGPVGHFIMNYIILEELLEKSEVSKIIIDAKESTVVLSAKCAVKDLEVNTDHLSFDMMAQALPFPIDDSYQGALDLIPFIENFNQEILTIMGLNKGSYSLQIDGNSIGTYSGAQLQEGVNLAVNTATPQYRQALEVKTLVEEYRELGARYRVIPAIEFKHLAAYRGSNEMDSIQLYLSKRLETMRDKPWYDYVRGNYEKYRDTKPQADSIIAQLEQLNEQIYQVNQPKAHAYQLSRIE